MLTNTHILTLNRLADAAHSLIMNIPDSTDKQALIAILDNMRDHLFAANTDIEIANRRIAELTAQIYSSLIEAQMNTRPKENAYNSVREYIEQRKQQDPVFKQYCHSHTRKQLCERLSEEFGWPVDEKSLGRNLLRH